MVLFYDCTLLRMQKIEFYIFLCILSNNHLFTNHYIGIGHINSHQEQMPFALPLFSDWRLVAVRFQLNCFLNYFDAFLLSLLGTTAAVLLSPTPMVALKQQPKPVGKFFCYRISWIFSK